MSIRSVHSRRTVPTQRSAIAFARGACGGVRITSAPAAVNTASNAAVNLLSRSRSRKVDPVLDVDQHVTRLLGDPGAGRMSGDPGQVHPAGGQLDEEQHVDPLEEHGVDGEGAT
jgi:hypothetical protein